MRASSKNVLSILEDVIIIFLLVFSLRLPIIKTSSYFLFMILLCRFFCISKYREIVINLINTKYVVNILFVYLLIIVSILLSTCLHFQFDLTLIPTIINITIHLFIAILIVALFLEKQKDLPYLLNILVAVFLIQSVIEILAYSFKPILEFVQLFQSKGSIEKAAAFHGRRGLALAGTLFYGLSCIFGFIFILIVKKWEYTPKLSIKDLIVYLLIFIGGFFTGRTFFIGFSLSWLYFFCANIKFRDKISIITKFGIMLIFIFLLILSIIPLLPNDLYQQLYNLIWYVFEAAFNYVEYGEVSTTSSDHLMSKMYFKIPLSTFIFGDGLYTGRDGAYYMHTDAGYMRNVLLFGVGGLFMLILSDIILLWGARRLRSKKMKMFNIVVFIYISIIHIKGEAFGYFISLHSILFLIYLLSVFSNYTKSSIKIKAYDY